MKWYGLSHARLEWIYSLRLLECQRPPCSKLVWYLKIKWLSYCSWTRPRNHLVRKITLNRLAKLTSLTKWFSVDLRTRWLWVRVLLHSLKPFYDAGIEDDLIKTAMLIERVLNNKIFSRKERQHKIFYEDLV